MSLGLRASSDEASTSAVKPEIQEDEDGGVDEDEDDNMDAPGSGDESEYAESRRDVTTRKRARKAKGVGQIDEGDESVRFFFSLPAHVSSVINA